MSDHTDWSYNPCGKLMLNGTSPFNLRLISRALVFYQIQSYRGKKCPGNADCWVECKIVTQKIEGLWFVTYNICQIV